MSTKIGCPLVSKKISSCVRPGVCEVRASALRPVSALIRLDLPTLERPANAISMQRMAGKTASEPAAAMKRQSPANSLRPRSISSGVKSVMQDSQSGGQRCTVALHDKAWRAPCPPQQRLKQIAQEQVARRCVVPLESLNASIAPLPILQAMHLMLLGRLLLSHEHVLDIVEQLDLGAVP